MPLGPSPPRYANLAADPRQDVVEAIGSRMAALVDGQVDLEVESKEMKEEAQARREVNGA